MSSLSLVIPAFILCAIIIFFAGTRLSHYGELLARKTGWGNAWVGLVLMASVTSLPELMVGISSSAFVQSADLAVGDVLGSCAFNLGILAIMDAFVPRHRHLFGIASTNHVLAAALGIILMVMVAFGIFLPDNIILSSWIGVTSIGFIIIYFVSVRLIFLNEKKHAVITAVIAPTPGETDELLSIKQLALRYTGYALIIVVAALSLPYFADQIVQKTGLGGSFVGTLFLASSTSLPEVAVTLAAIRMGAIDLGVGNILGSNIFNILILAIDDIFYTKGHILKHANPVHIVSILSTILMSAIVIIGLVFRTEGKRYKLAWDAALIFLVYILNMIILYYMQ